MESDAYWTQLLLTLSEGRPEGMRMLNEMDTTEFWHYFKAWRSRQEAIAASYRQ